MPWKVSKGQCNFSQISMQDRIHFKLRVKEICLKCKPETIFTMAFFRKILGNSYFVSSFGFVQFQTVYGFHGEIVIKYCLIVFVVKISKALQLKITNISAIIYHYLITIFQLNLCLFFVNYDCFLSPTAESRNRPNDVNVLIQLLNLYLDSGRSLEAYNKAMEYEDKQAFRLNLEWYRCLSRICMVCFHNTELFPPKFRHWRTLKEQI